MSGGENKGILLARVRGKKRRTPMRRYQTDRYGMIASFDIAEALRRAESRRRESERRAREGAAQKAERVGLMARLRALMFVPRRSTI
jgi:hypothetical protein